MIRGAALAGVFGVSANEKEGDLENSEEETNYEGIWSLQIGSDFGWRTSGILILENGRALGGNDRAYAYGAYEESEGKLRISVHLHYYRSPRFLFGVKEKDLDLLLVGKRLQDTVEGQAERRNMPGMTLPVRLTWRAPVVVTR